jgi:hypothetical protein
MVSVCIYWELLNVSIKDRISADVTNFYFNFYSIAIVAIVQIYAGRKLSHSPLYGSKDGVESGVKHRNPTTSFQFN